MGACGVVFGCVSTPPLAPVLDDKPVREPMTMASPRIDFTPMQSVVPKHPPTLLRGGTVMTAEGDVFAPGYVLLVDGKIAAVGAGSGNAPQNTQIVDVSGTWVTPGIIDTHSHMGVYAAPSMEAHQDGNEATKPVTAEAWAESAFWPQDPNLPRALAAGVTTIQVLPGSANLIGGRSFTAKLRLPATHARALRIEGAPQGMKMACGENPKRTYGEKGGPQTRMGNVAGYRAAFQDAREYRRRWQIYERDVQRWQSERSQAVTKMTEADVSAEQKNALRETLERDPPEAPHVDAGMETLMAVLDGEILVHNHCYRADEMSQMMDMADEFGFRIRSFHHALEAYKIRPRLREEQVSVSTWVDWWGFKMESYDGIRANLALLQSSGVRAIMHSDSEVEIRQLNQEVGKALAAGDALGIKLSDDEALRMITLNPAWAIGLDQRLGSLKVGKDADVVVWDHQPFSVYAKPTHVYVEGSLLFDGKQRRPSDFELGTGSGLQ
jgi:imidazolonepropionase-like amidohydrolase